MTKSENRLKRARNSSKSLNKTIFVALVILSLSTGLDTKIVPLPYTHIPQKVVHSLDYPIRSFIDFNQVNLATLKITTTRGKVEWNSEEVQDLLPIKEGSKICKGCVFFMQP